MVKFVVAALWLCAVSLGGAWFATRAPTQAEAAAAAEPPPPLLGGLDYVKSDVITVPLVKDDAIAGYLLTRLVYTVEPEKLRKLSVPADALFADEILTYVFGHPQFDFTARQPVDIDAFRNGIRDSVNKRVGETLVQDVLVEQIDFLSKTDIRDNAIRRRSGGAAPGEGGGNKVASPNSHF